MGSFPNSHRQKREEQHDAHNRKSGAAASFKRMRNQMARRELAKSYRNLVDTWSYATAAPLKPWKPMGYTAKVWNRLEMEHVRVNGQMVSRAEFLKLFPS